MNYKSENVWEKHLEEQNAMFHKDMVDVAISYFYWMDEYVYDVKRDTKEGLEEIIKVSELLTKAAKEKLDDLNKYSETISDVEKIIGRTLTDKDKELVIHFKKDLETFK